MTPTLSDEVASSWFISFAECLQHGDVAGTTSLFLPNGWLRDFLAFNWDLRTLHGHEKISSYLSEHLPTSKFYGFELASDQYFKPSAGVMPGTVNAGFTFSTPIANGRGYCTLTSTTEIDDMAGWKASTVFMTLDSLNGYEEDGAAEDIYDGRCPTWGEARDMKWRKAEQEPEVLIIGAGQNGLQVAARLRQMKIPTLVVEKNDRVGDTWRRRYPTLTLHTPKTHHSLLYQPFPSNWPFWTPRDKLADWLEQYVFSQDLLVWTKSRVMPGPTYNRSSKEWTVTVDKAGQIFTLHPKHVIVATGMLGEPYVPTIEDQDIFEGQIMHSEGFSGGADFTGKRVIVVGTGNSGADIALDLSTHNARSVTMMQRSSTCVQPASIIAEQHLQVYPTDVPVEVSDFRAFALPTLRLFEILAETRGMSWDREKDLIEGLREAGLKVDMGPHGAGILPLVYLRFGGFWMDVGCGKKIISREIKVKSGVEIQKFTKNSMIFSDGSKIEADVVIFATGYRNMSQTLKNLLSDEIIHETHSLPYGLDEEGEYEAGYRPTGHPGLWFAPGSFNNSRLQSKYLGIQLQAANIGYLKL
ncbi:FAD/NAD-P-binding domain-containing protein [Lentinula detonsa]|uniref:FAD/NAD-P-binding domain-containing protein n=1 Tax=Lentinula detonsa TaxID=2804962 RepID=A0AA38PWQ1_9AGAR|nr:FAD/NAD-P-binding domain-containing protein [Lentinula detonsa]